MLDRKCFCLVHWREVVNASFLILVDDIVQQSREWTTEEGQPLMRLEDKFEMICRCQTASAIVYSTRFTGQLYITMQGTQQARFRIWMCQNIYKYSLKTMKQLSKRMSVLMCGLGVILTLLSLMRALEPERFRGETMSYLEKLVVLDPMRRNYYSDLRK